MATLIGYIGTLFLIVQFGLQKSYEKSMAAR